MLQRSILWFRQDLRLHDNESLLEAVRSSDELIPVYIIDPAIVAYGAARRQFLLESVKELRAYLRHRGSDLVVRTGAADEILYEMALETKCQWVFCNRERTRDEVQIQDRLEQKLWTIGRELRYSRGKMLYYTADLPFPVTHCPDAFAAFKKEVENFIPVRPPLNVPDKIPPFPSELDAGFIPDISGKERKKNFDFFYGGEGNGILTLQQLYPIEKQDHIDGEGRRLSPWISLGCLSPKKVYHESYKWNTDGEETRQNLIYRDYLRLMGKKYGDRIFYASGIRNKKLFSKHDPMMLHRWQSGQTDIDIVDAGMRQLLLTGWIPDTIRRLVAGYFLKVLQLDWRLGAAWFESQLIDYDPCTNWVSWQNIAGIGPDAKEDRTIHFEMAGRKLDPDGSYISAWKDQI